MFENIEKWMAEKKSNCKHKRVNSFWNIAESKSTCLDCGKVLNHWKRDFKKNPPEELEVRWSEN